MIETRQAHPSDIEFVRRVHHAAYHNVVVAQFGEWNEEQQDALFLAKWNPSELQIMERNGEASGTLLLEYHTDHIFLSEIQLLPAHQSQGIGSELIHTELAQAISEGKAVRLHVLHKNERAKRLYEKLGFRVCGEMDTHFTMKYSIGS